MADYFNNFFYRPYRNMPVQISFRDYKLSTKDDSYSILIQNFKEKIRLQILDILISQKNISEDKANVFIDKLLSPDYNNRVNINKEIEKCYNDGLSKEDCAQSLIDKYYDKTKINFFSGKNNHEEITESVQVQGEYNKISSSLFYNFINKLKNLDIKFILNNRYIKGVDNSLNSDGYNLFMETKQIDSKIVEHEFKLSRILSSVVTSINLYTNSNIKISFYIGIDKKSNINIGYVIDDKRIKIGNFKYSTTDIKKITHMIETTDKEMDVNMISNKFLSTLFLIQYYKDVFIDHLQSYDEDINIYTSIIDNKFAIIIESLDTDIISYKYLSNMINDNIFNKLPFKYNWKLNSKMDKKLFYYFTID